MTTTRPPTLKAEKVSVHPDVQPGVGTSTEYTQRFRVQQLLGEGGMGSVFVAHDRGLGRVVALKLLREGLENDQRALRRFILEAQIGAQLEHPNIVPLYSFERSESGLPAIAMQLLEGMTMGDYIEAAAAAPASARSIRGEYSLKERIGRLLGVCEAIHFAHERGVIHRDLKPDNVMLGHYREVYVMDWGLARVTDGAIDMLGEPSLTQDDGSSPRHEQAALDSSPPKGALLDEDSATSPTVMAPSDAGNLPKADSATSPTVMAPSGNRNLSETDSATSATVMAPSSDGNLASNATRYGDVMGTPQYMPPEQALGLVDLMGPAADQYALGLMLFELATLKEARSHASTMTALTEAVQNQLAPAVDIDGRSIHPALKAIIARATQKEPADRYLSVAAMSADIRCFTRDEPVSVYREGLARRTVRAAARRPVLAMALLSVCGFLSSVAVVGAVVHDTVQVKRQARTLENTRRVLVAVTSRTQEIDVKFSDVAAGIQAVGAATVELLARDTATVEPVRWTTPVLTPLAGVGGAPASFDSMVQFWPGKSSGALPTTNATKLPRVEQWLRRTLVASLPPIDRTASVTSQNAAMSAGKSSLVRAFVGLQDGAYAQYPARTFDADYDPRERPWYRTAQENEALHWTRPFADVAGKTLRISAVIGLRSDDTFVGAAGCDLRVASLVPDLALDLPGFQQAYLVMEDGKVAVSAELEKSVLATTTEHGRDHDLALPPVANAELARRIAQRDPGGYFAEGDLLFVYSRMISPPWTYVAELDRKRYLED